jgi:hypothetical protein
MLRPDQGHLHCRFRIELEHGGRLGSEEVAGLARVTHCHVIATTSFGRHVVRSTQQLRSRDAETPGFCNFSTPMRGAAERRRRNLCRAGKARRAPCHRCTRLPALPPWRFLFRGPLASRFGICAEGCSETSSRPGRNAGRADSQTSRVRGYEPRPQDAKSRSAFRNVFGDGPSWSETVFQLS